MAHSYRTEGPGGLTHVVLGAGIIMAIGLFTNFPDTFLEMMGKKNAPSMIRTQSSKTAMCSSNSVDTIIGNIGCAGTQHAAHMSKITLKSSVAKN
jgi:hypothetical protein